MNRLAPRDLIEYASLRLGVALVDTLPLKTALSFGRALGSAAHFSLQRRRQMARQNILLAGCAADETEAARIAKESFKSFGMLAIESLAASRIINADTLGEHCEFDWPETARALVDAPGRGVILASAHLGNWEVSGHVGSFRKRTVAVARNMDNPLAQRFFLRRNPRRNMEIIGKHGGGKSLSASIKDGCLLGLICDQHASGGGIICDFLGRPAKTITSPARLHLSTRAPIICVCCVRVGEMKFKVHSAAPISCDAAPADHAAAIRYLTQEINARLGAYIRQYPEQYLWSHNRWREQKQPNG